MKSKMILIKIIYITCFSLAVFALDECQKIYKNRGYDFHCETLKDRRKIPSKNILRKVLFFEVKHTLMDCVEDYKTNLNSKNALQLYYEKEKQEIFYQNSRKENIQCLGVLRRRIKELLEILNRSFDLAILSSNDPEFVHLALEAFQLDKYFPKSRRFFVGREVKSKDLDWFCVNLRHTLMFDTNHDEICKVKPFFVELFDGELRGDLIEGILLDRFYAVQFALDRVSEIAGPKEQEDSNAIDFLKRELPKYYNKDLQEFLKLYYETYPKHASQERYKEYLDFDLRSMQ